jgi:hypothetical protein
LTQCKANCGATHQAEIEWITHAGVPAAVTIIIEHDTFSLFTMLDDNKALDRWCKNNTLLLYFLSHRLFHPTFPFLSLFALRQMLLGIATMTRKQYNSLILI